MIQEFDYDDHLEQNHEYSEPWDMFVFYKNSNKVIENGCQDDRQPMSWTYQKKSDNNVNVFSHFLY